MEDLAPKVCGNMWIGRDQVPFFSCFLVSDIFFLQQVRKPYTITKQRERWTEDEHRRFLEALKLHGRAWRRIEGIMISAPPCISFWFPPFPGATF